MQGSCATRGTAESESGSSSLKRLATARSWIDQISLEWDAAIERLRRFVED